MSEAAHKFWAYQNDSTKYEQLAKVYELNIERAYPDRVTSRSMCHCLDYAKWCGFPLNGKAEYYEYSGPNVQNI
jgi:hypothetical protein